MVDSTQNSSSPAPEQDEEVLLPLEEVSAEKLEEILNQEDPEFVKGLSGIAEDQSLSLSEIFISSEDQELYEVRQLWLRSRFPIRQLAKILPFLPLLHWKWRRLRFHVFALLRSFWVRAKNFFYFLATEGRHKVSSKTKDSFKWLSGHIALFKKQFSNLSWKGKIVYSLLVFASVLTTVFIYKSFSGGVISEKTELYLRSFGFVADHVYQYEPESQEPFFENLRISSHILLLPKMIVNLKKSKGSGENPMGAFEFYVQGMAPEVIVEVKDREVEVRDLMHRALEERTFEQLDDPQGKQTVLEDLGKQLNSFLTTGKIKRVFIKTIVLKP